MWYTSDSDHNARPDLVTHGPSLRRRPHWRREHAKPWGAGFALVASRAHGGAGAGAETGMAGEAGGGTGARRGYGDRGRAVRTRRGGRPGRSRAPARRGEAAHRGAPGPDRAGAGDHGRRAPPVVRGLRADAGQQGPLPRDVPLAVWERAGPGPAVAGLPLSRPRRAEELCRPGPWRGMRSRPSFAYVTARYAALVPFGKVAALLSELLPVSGAQHAGTVRNRRRRVGEAVVQPYSTEIAEQPAAPAAG